LFEKQFQADICQKKGKKSILISVSCQLSEWGQAATLLTGPPGEKDASYSPNSLEGLRENEEKRDIFGEKTAEKTEK